MTLRQADWKNDNEGQVGNSVPNPVAGMDLTGRDKLVSNVLVSWGNQLVFFVAGFIMPRMIDRRLGKDILCIWDCSWSLVTYFRLVALGALKSKFDFGLGITGSDAKQMKVLGASTNFVAKHSEACNYGAV